jgi:hypothetical protein
VLASPLEPIGHEALALCDSFMNELPPSKDDHHRKRLTANKNISDIPAPANVDADLTQPGRWTASSHRSNQEEQISMAQFSIALRAVIIVTFMVSNAALISTPAGAAPMSDADKAAAKQAAATCRAQVKEQAQYHEMSLYARHKAVKKCIDDTLKH